MNFRVGERVVCINDSLDNIPTKHKGISVTMNLNGLKKGLIYTVRETGLASWFDNSPAIRLIEIVRPRDCIEDDPPFWASRFRPLVEHKTDISILEKLLNPENHHDMCDNA